MRFRVRKRTGCTVQLQLTQKCNYHCSFCPSPSARKQELKPEEWKAIIDNIEFSALVDEISFFGGDPTFFLGWTILLDYALYKGFHVSFLSNGSRLSDERKFPKGTFQKIQTLDLPVNSIKPKTLQTLGCCTSDGDVLTEQRLKEIIATARQENPNLSVRIHTLVTASNKHENLAKTIKHMDIDEWTIQPLFGKRIPCISKSDYQEFLRRNGYPRIRSQQGTVLFVDCAGNLVKDGKPLGNLLYEDFARIFQKFHLRKAEKEQPKLISRSA